MKVLRRIDRIRSQKMIEFCGTDIIIERVDRRRRELDELVTRMDNQGTIHLPEDLQDIRKEWSDIISD